MKKVLAKEEFMQAYRKFKAIVDSKSEEKQLDKQFYENFSLFYISSC